MSLRGRAQRPRARLLGGSHGAVVHMISDALCQTIPCVLQPFTAAIKRSTNGFLCMYVQSRWEHISLSLSPEQFYKYISSIRIAARQTLRVEASFPSLHFAASLPLPSDMARPRPDQCFISGTFSIFAKPQSAGGILPNLRVHSFLN